MKIRPVPTVPTVPAVTTVPMALSAPTVSLTGCTKRYRSHTVLQDLDLDLRPGITGLLGPNGAGKTTLLRIVATVLRHDAGTVRVLGRDPARADDRHDIRCRLGYQAQEPGFYQGFSVTDFLDYVAILKELADRRARRREVWRVVELVELGSVARTAIRKLSGGMRRRVALAAALLGAPELLILDEPTTGLDPEQRMRFRQVVSDLAGECTIVLSTHLTEDVAALCDRVVVLDGGRTRFDGRPSELAALAAGRVTRIVRVERVERPEGVAPTVEDGYLCLLGRDRDRDRDRESDPDTAEVVP